MSVSSGSPSGTASDPREAAERLREFVVERLGTRRVTVGPAGPEDEIAVVRVPPDLLARLLLPENRSAVVDRAREEGFRYAALDLSPLEPGTPPSPGGDLA